MPSLRWVGAFVLLGSAIAGLTLWLMAGPTVPERDLSGLTGDLNRGAYVARLAGCIGCHTNAKAGGAVLAGGAEITTEFGSFYAPNITLHPDDGIGRWTLADFARALTAGKSPDGQHYFPAFPYSFYTRMSDQDVVDLWTAVRSVPPVAGGPRGHDLGFPFGFRQGIGIWKRAFFEPKRLAEVAGQSPSWSRGRYLARGPGHCGACHTPRNVFGARQTDRRYAGGVGPGDEKIPAITPAALAAEGWTRDDLVFALRSGVLPDGDVFGGSMAEVVRESTRYWSDEDLGALVEYILNAEVEG